MHCPDCNNSVTDWIEHCMICSIDPTRLLNVAAINQSEYEQIINRTIDLNKKDIVHDLQNNQHNQ